MNKILNLLFIFTLGPVAGCLVENAKPQELKGSTEQDTSIKIDMADAEIDVKPEEIVCKKSSDCVVIDKGCCHGEKRIVVNKVSALALLSKKRVQCADLGREKHAEMLESLRARRKAKRGEARPELKHELCYGRRAVGFLIGEDVECKKEPLPKKEEPPKEEGPPKEGKEEEKEKSPAQKAQERWKEAQEEEEREGKCVIIAH